MQKFNLLDPNDMIKNEEKFLWSMDQQNYT